jgi:hypothetical protein
MELPEDLRSVRLGGRAHRLHAVTGKVLHVTTRSETEVHGGGGGGGGGTYGGTGWQSTAPVAVTSTTTRYSKLFLRDLEGQEHALDLVDFVPSCRPGNVVSILWAVREGRRRGPYLAAYNHDTRTVEFPDDRLRGISKEPMLVRVATWAVLTRVLFQWVYGMAARDGMVFVAYLFSPGIALVALLGNGVSHALLGTIRGRAFIRGEEIARVRAALERLPVSEYRRIEGSEAAPG